MDGSTYNVNEDILVEQSILKYITHNKECPESIVKFHQFLHSDSHYYLIMEDGGTSLFDFVKKAHRLIKKKKVSISEWQKVTKIIFLQMLDCLNFLHTHNIVHFDLSLENFLINDVEVQIQRYGNDTERVRFVLNDIQIKLCDFGMAQLFTRKECLASKFCGKKVYKSPEIIEKKKNFNAKLNDVWCFGICLFMICVGFPPFNIVSVEDKPFLYIMDRDMRHLLTAWKVLHYFDKELLDLFESIFEYERLRISLTQINNHAWVKSILSEEF